MKYNLCFSIFLVMTLLVSSKLLAQTSDDNGITTPSPIMGWDSLGKSINYPGLLAGGLEGRILVMIYVDTLGKADDVAVGDFIGIASNDTMKSNSIRQYILNCFNDVKWIPAIKNGKKIDYRISIPIYFILRKERQVDPIIVRGIMRHIDK